MRPIICAFFLAVQVFVVGEVAAREMVPAPRQSAGAVLIQYIRFKPDTAATVRGIEARLDKAANTAGLPPTTRIQMRTGPWHAVYIVQLLGGLAEMDGQPSKSDADFINALARQEGRMDSALKLTASWDETIDQIVVEAGHLDTPLPTPSK
jgi:hypothetical protein